ncbi:hypothetical protein GAY33_10630 [Azospirillum brasilense]|uniref:type IV secretion system protein n=1 Tax=Azospirillum argentinense TaxID=2970906 RepID=UPI00190D8465|nr:type IV secretion system protein [Azospirillum argentinense]MBK3799681.1 hypothetical protein [Azospirillum argentinense]
MKNDDRGLATAIAIAFFAALVILLPDTAQAQSSDASCIACGLTERIEKASRTFREASFKNLVGPASSFGRMLGLLWIYLFAVQIFLQPSQIPRFLETFLGRVGWLLAMVGILSAPQWILDNIVTAGEQTFMGVAAYVLGTAQSAFGGTASVPPVGDSAWYTALWREVEGTVFPLVLKLIRAGAPGGWLDLAALPRLILTLLIVAPFGFVLGIFMAFMVQVIFYTAAVTAIGPLLVVGLPWGTTRSYLWGALKFMLGGGFTLVFAAVAMGTTSAMLQSQFQNATLGDPSPEALKKLLDITNPEYWYTFIVGLVSVLLHLAAPRIASNIAGVTDSATSAAMVTAAGQAGAAKAGGMAHGKLFGGGARNSIFDSAGNVATGGMSGAILNALPKGGQQMADVVAQRGLVGLAGAGAAAGARGIAAGLRAAYHGTRGNGAPGA